MLIIPIEKEAIPAEFIPEEFEMELGIERFILGINYNQNYDFFSVDVYDVERNPLVLGERLQLNIPLWADIDDPRLPAPTIIPVDPSGQETAITFENFMVTTFLKLDQEADEDE